METKRNLAEILGFVAEYATCQLGSGGGTPRVRCAIRAA